MKCTHDPKETKGAIGMYHCPECGEMVLAGVDHPDYENMNFDELERLNERDRIKP